MKIIIFIMFFCFGVFADAQIRPNLLLDDMDEHSLSLQCYCKPGVRNKTRSKGIELSYQFIGEGLIRPANDDFAAPYPEYTKFRKFKTKISLPLIRNPQFKGILSFGYKAEQFELRNSENDYQDLIKGTDNLNFKSTSIDASFSYSLNATNYIGGRLRTSFNGSYNGLINWARRYTIYSGALAFGIKKDENNEWGLGIAGSKNFRSQGFRVLPFAFWNKTLSDNWGFQITFPTSYTLRYNINPKTIMVLGANYNGESYSYDQALNNSRTIAFNHSEILSVFRLERQIVPWLWIDLSGGYHFNYNSDFELQETGETLLEISPGNSAVFKIGLFISPPDSFMK